MTDPSEYIDDPALLLGLANAGLSDIQIDSPQYLEKRYMNEMPKPAMLRDMVGMRNYIMEHEGENFNLTDIADEIGTTQPRLSNIMRDYPLIFKKMNGSYVVSTEIPEEWMEAYHAQNIPDSGVRPQRPQSDPKIKEILDLVKKIYNNTQIDKIKQPVKLKSRAYLEDTIVDAVLKEIVLGEKDTKGKTLDDHLNAFFVALKVFETQSEEVMRQISKFLAS
jgi:hypothetical protein